MKFLKRSLVVILSLLLTSLITAWSILAIVGSATAINQLIVAGNLYEMMATQTRTAMLSSANLPDQYREVMTQAFEKSMTAQQVETIMKPLLVDIVGWLDQPDDTPPPQLIINLAPLKTSLASELAQSQTSEIEKTALVAQIGKQIPDQVDVNQVQGLASQQRAQTPEAATESASQATTTLKAIKSGLHILKVFALYGLLAFIALLVWLIFLGRKDGRAMLRRPAWICISAGLLTTLIWVVSNGVPINPLQPELTIGLRVIRSISSIVVWYSLGSLLFGAGLYGLSYIVKSSTVALPPANPIAPPPTTQIFTAQNQVSQTTSPPATTNTNKGGPVQN
jgi:hypothetical protein